MSERNVPEVRFRGFSGEWAWYELGKIGNTYTGLSGKTKNDFGHGSGKYVTYMNVFSNAIANLYDIEKIEVDATQNEIKMGDVFFTTSSETPEEVGMSSVWLADTKNVYLNSFCFGYRSENIFDYYYLAYMLRSPFVRKKITFLAQGISRYNISKNKVMNISVSVPQMQEQAKIGEFFKNLDDLIAQNQKKYDKLVNMKKACLDKMFPKDGADTPEVRFKGFGGEWENCNLKESSQSIEYGLNAAATKFDGENKYIRITDIDDELRIFLKNDLSSPCIELSNADNYKLQKGDIVFARTGASVGKSYKYNETDGLVYYAGFLIRARLKPEYNPTFIFQNTLTKKYEKYIQITSQRSGQPGVNAQEYSEFSFFAASFDEQTKIGGFFQILDNLIALRKTELEKLKNIKKACLDKMFI